MRHIIKAALKVSLIAALFAHSAVKAESSVWKVSKNGKASKLSLTELSAPFAQSIIIFLSIFTELSAPKELSTYLLNEPSIFFVCPILLLLPEGRWFSDLKINSI